MAEQFTVFLDARFTADERERIGSAIIDYITNRTRRGRGINNEPFTNRSGKKAYSKAYQDHRDFEAGGKNNAPINLTLTGDMLSSIEIIDNTLAGRIVIGISDEENSNKARWMREKGYSFLGLSESEKNTILSRFAKVTVEEVRASNIASSVARTFLRGLFGG